MADPRPVQDAGRRYAIVPDLKAGGYTHYVVAPLFFTNGTQNGITFATRAPEGFRDDDIAILRFVMPALAAVMEMRVLNKQLDHVLRLYVATSRTGRSWPATSAADR